MRDNLPAGIEQDEFEKAARRLRGYVPCLQKTREDVARSVVVTFGAGGATSTCIVNLYEGFWESQERIAALEGQVNDLQAALKTHLRARARAASHKTKRRKRSPGQAKKQPADQATAQSGGKTDAEA